MGCLGMEVVDPEVEKLLASLDSKVKEYEKTFVTKVQEMKKAQSDQLKQRHDKLSELKQNNQEITEDVIKSLNKEELKVEKKFLENAVDKMHFIFNTGLDLVEPLRKITLDQLLEKAKSAPAMAWNQINKQIEEVKNLPVVDFLNATYGKILKDALEKKGMSVAFMKSTRKSIFKERQERRKLEREEFGIKVNEFEDEKIDDIKLDLSSLIFGDDENGGKEFVEEFNKNYKDFIRDKMIDQKYGK